MLSQAPNPMMTLTAAYRNAKRFHEDVTYGSLWTEHVASTTCSLLPS